uniref:Uncharacterized protein n=1 Tax=Panagrolaimus sp. PS1159 TaxID=55785 RepID=A0AC35F0V1_9BILA
EVAPKKQKTQYNLRPRKTAMTTMLITLCCLFTAVAAECPSWATKCASTPISAADMEKSSTFAQETYAALLNHLPDICSIRNHQICSKTPTKKTVHKIQLYDLSEHYVDELVIIEHPLPVLHLDGVDIPIRAWGTSNIEVFDYPPKVTTCSSCTATCVKGGILLNLDSAVNVAEVCAIDHCEKIMVPKLQETINLPKDVVIRPYPVTIRSWINGLEVQNQKLECPANVLCEQLECTICWDKLWNNHCIETWEVVLFSLLHENLQKRKKDF